MALLTNVLQEDDILCELYTDTRSDISDYSDSENSGSDIDISTSSRKQLQSSVVVVTSDSETSTIEEESSDNITSDVWCKMDKKPSNEPFLGTTGLNIVIDNPESVPEVVSSVIGDDLILLLTEQSNLYHSQNAEKWKVSPKTLKWSNITPEEMRKFLGLIILMGQVRKDNIRDYWSTDPTISTPIFPRTMSRNRFESIWQAWHFSDNSQQTQDSGRLFKIWPVYEYFAHKFRSVYSPKQELSLDESMIPWRGRLKFRTYNPGKITKYGVLVRMVCEAVSGYVYNMEIYSAEGKKLEDTVLSLLDRNLDQNHHLYQDNFYNSVRLAETLLDRKVRVCGTMRVNRGIPRDLEEDGKRLKKGQSAFRRKGDVMVQVWKDKRLVRMISTIHDATVVSTGRKDRKTNMEIKKPYAVVQYNKFMKGVDRADQYLSNCSVLRKTVKWSKKVVLYLLNCALFNAFCVYRTLNTNKKVKYKNFLHEVGRSWISEVLDRGESDSDDLQLPEKQTTPRGPKQDPPCRLSGDFRIHKLEKIVGGGEGKRKYPARQCKVCAAHKKRSETRYICKICVVPLHKGSCFEKYHSVTNY